MAASTRHLPVRPASTVALLRRRARGGIETLLTHRPPTMAFGPGLHVFPGGAVDASDGDPAGSLAGRSALDAIACSQGWAGSLAPDLALAHAVAAVRECWEEAGLLLARHRDGSPVAPSVVAAALEGREGLAALAERLDLVLATDALVPLSRWVTPPTTDVSRRYDTRFYVADLPDGAEVVADALEVAAHDWLSPGEALARYASRTIDLWPPTSTSLRQLDGADGAASVRRWLSPLGPAPDPRFERLDEGLARIRLGAAGGIPGVTVNAWIVGRRRVVVVDPGDPGDVALEALLDATSGSGLELAGVVLTSAAPDHVGGAVGLALVAGVPLLASGAAVLLVGEPCEPVSDGDLVDLGDVTLRVRAMAGSRDGGLMLEAAALGVVLAGDVGTRGPSRAIPDGDEADARARQAAILDAIPGRRLPAHD
jgi:8-oxo-dGTP pyrophosphatase MutT (NUDIX family)/glyoxylase-like metal-dependent hydrolase (beta-lactamase superfamily II)